MHGPVSWNVLHRREGVVSKVHWVDFVLRFALKILDNLNLRKLWDWPEKSALKINGSASFNFNPKLCYKSILELVERGIVERDKLVASNTTNGDQIICKWIRNVKSQITASQILMSFFKNSEIKQSPLSYFASTNF
jgi:hypothetical protein